MVRGRSGVRYSGNSGSDAGQNEGQTLLAERECNIKDDSRFAGGV